MKITINVKKIFATIWKMLRSNLMLKITALLFAVILWSYVVAEINPTRTRTLDEVPVRYDINVLSDQQLAISQSLSDMPDMVSATVAVQQSEVNNLSKQNVVATVDLGAITGPGEYELPIKATITNGKVLETSPGIARVYVDRYVTRTVPVTVRTTGEVASGYYAYEPVITPSVVSVSGALTDVAQVTSALCTVSLNGLTQGFSQTMDIDLLDSSGNEVDKALFSDVPTVIVDLNVEAMKTVPVDVESSIVDQDRVAAGYEVESITCLPTTVDIAGDAALLSDIDSVRLVSYSLSGKSASESVLLDFEPIEGVAILYDQKAQVFLTIREITETKTYEDVSIKLKDLPRGLEAQLGQSRVDVTVVASEQLLSKLSRSDIVPYVDLDGLEAGVYSLDVQFELPEGFSKENFSASSSTVTVKLD